MDDLFGSSEQAQEIVQTLWTLCLTYAPKLLLALVTLIVGLWLINKVVNLTLSKMEKNVDPTLHKFIGSLVSVGLKGLLLISVASMVGIATTSFIAVLGAAGLAIGLALQGSLSNFAGGVLILIFKPFKVGDLIEGGGHLGVVKEIQIFNTILTTADNRRVIIPNGVLSNNSLINVNVEPTRRVDFVFGIGYGDDIKKTKEILQRIADNDSRVLKDPAPTIVLSELADSSVNFTVRLWVNTADYWGVYFDTHEAVKTTFDAEGISIPFPQQDVHMHQVA
ncbi:mechanosensitive ion channel family protein [Alkalimarinus sediminis]|uniref:Small-conductance mechanosensitive channel n=1 Tax=Alkalimarinus sediminis TaxID=1632866 RepID=A0A9E8HGX9_9ALTE|nr:mechanosensitive ion channel domain-containing protein [Alkalimarinus sediminis]UZW73997.1 mechanosensitive ion channel [Alkalimarinus sediminis]